MGKKQSWKTVNKLEYNCSEAKMIADFSKKGPRLIPPLFLNCKKILPSRVLWTKKGNPHRIKIRLHKGGRKMAFGTTSNRMLNKN